MGALERMEGDSAAADAPDAAAASANPGQRPSSRTACLRLLSVAVPAAMAVGALFVILVAAGLGRAMDPVPAFAAAGMMALYAVLQGVVGAVMRRARRVHP